MTQLLRLDGLNRAFGERQALKDVTFDVAPGRLTGFVGANGAGKTTTMRIILGVLAADSGTVTWGGAPLTRADRRRFGYMPEERGLYPKMTIREQLTYFGRLHGLDAGAVARNITSLLDRLGIGERADEQLEKLSLGNQQRAQIAAALVHQPQLLVLDEPFSGLDPIAVDTVVAVLREQTARGVPVLFSSHQLDVVERLCDDLVIIGDGAILTAGRRDELRAAYALPRYEIRVDGDAGWLRDQPGVTMIDLDGPRAVFDLDTGVEEQSVLRAALNRGPVRAFTPVAPTLAEIFREVAR
ncbi:ATP-binding cassette domain-containing protein [Phytohabitans flavus]|uniref:ABC transporter ATP-binding protein n=1 Tax=Phytohabitans flavus TaxID=1076124 RepID=A0A6F8XN88_9ACTN|nr:ATP-binding cassette domain-containing protein [Phytohabitans flavus]BCB75283.1 ABC transporter ATP-binding protein [Phytohabitans flavus]